jgi:cyanophycin synthetase
MNIFNLPHCQVMVDYAHNTAGFEMLKSFMQRTSATHKIGIIAAAGDRRDQDIINMGKCAAEMFDEIIIRHDKDGRGRTNESLNELFQKGIDSVSTDFPRTIISDELEALKHAIKEASKGAFIVVCSDDIHNTIEYLSSLVAQNSRVAV